jgi:serine protease Do
VLAIAPLTSPADTRASDLRRTAIVKAVEAARDSVVNIHGQKTLTGAEDASLRSDSPRRVNGMGTGVVIDERGYILTNHHVVDGVRKIEVTLADKSTYIAQLVSSDPVTDLAVIKINVSRTLPPMTAGTSEDLMIGEPVIAMGNAFGYEHTVTRGIISALHRSVQVSDAQSYEDLIQTDASINPGNSGGPLMNIDGQMIGLNVAVRAGAQGIGFAIPVDKAMTIAGELLSVARLENRWHGIVAKPGLGSADGMIVHSVEKDSPAARAGIKAGDVIKGVNGKDVVRSLDFERALLGDRDDEFEVHVARDREPVQVSLALAVRPRSIAPQNDQTWEMLGLRLAPVPSQQFKQYNSRYRGGLAIVAVRAEGPAARQGIRRGDVLVGMHEWETVTPENVDYILNRPDFHKFDPVKFYILRTNDQGSEVLYGHLAVSATSRERQ